ncbi:unnamed protein product [Schistosoma turkestanicum]|nr:unnamed protein product [Schistosoma turkestanicum]
MISQLQQQLQHQHRHHTFDTPENKANLSQFCLNLPELNSIHTLIEYDTKIDCNNQQSIEQGKLNTSNDSADTINNHDNKSKTRITITSTNISTIEDSVHTKQVPIITDHCLSRKNKLENQFNEYNKSISLNSSHQHRLRYSPNTTTTVSTTTATTTTCDTNCIGSNSEICNTPKYPRLHHSLPKSNNSNHSNLIHNNNISNYNDGNILAETDNQSKLYAFQRNVKQLIDYELNNHLKNEYISVDHHPQLQLQPTSPLLSSLCTSSLNNNTNNEHILSSLIHENNNNNHIQSDNDNNNNHNVNEEISNEQDGGELYRRRNTKIDDSVLDSLNVRLGRTMEKMDVLNHLQKFSKLIMSSLFETL